MHVCAKAHTYKGKYGLGQMQLWRDPWRLPVRRARDSGRHSSLFQRLELTVRHFKEAP